MAAASGRNRLTRRTLLKAGGAAAAVTTAVGADVLYGADPVQAAVPTSKYFDLGKPSYDLFRHKLLHESHHAMQGFAFDNVNRKLFVAQIRNGSSGDDLCINQLSFAGNKIGEMHLNGAGHGVSIGVQPVGASSYIWTECDAHRTDTSGRGTALARFKFVDGATPSVKKFLRGSSTITCATDPVYRRIVVRRKENGAMWFSLYNLADAAAGDFTKRLAHFRQPALSSTSVTFQGYTIYGRYLYTLDGTGHANAADINSYVTRIDMNDGKVKSRFLTKAGKSLVYREPEGMAIYRTSGGQTRLFLGFASRPSMGSSTRHANLFFKNALIG